MSGWVEIGAACTVASALTTATPTETGWEETVRYELASSGGCRTVALHFDPGTAIASLAGRTKLGDGTGAKLIPGRFETQPPTRDGAVTVLVHLGEMLSGDRVRLDVVQRWDSDASYRWTPARSRAVWAELSVPKDTAMTGFGDVTVDFKKSEAWVANPTGAEAVVVPPHRAAAYPRSMDGTTVAEAGLDLDTALARMESLVRIDAAFDGASVVAGDAALSRGLVDDRGWARTLVALTAGGPDQVALGFALPPHPGADPVRDAVTETAVVTTPAGPVALMHPEAPSWEGPVQITSAEGGTAQDLSWTRRAEPAGLPVVALNRELKLQWEGSPDYELFPGAGSWLEVDDELTVPADVATVVRLPLDGRAEVASIEAGDDRVLRAGHALIFALGRGEPRTVKVHWRRDDAPTYGTRLRTPDLAVDQQVRAYGSVRWEGDDWWLARAEETPILPSREALLRALEYRFAILSYPEPALPSLLKGRGAGWSSAEDLPAALRERVRPAPLDQDPLWPRRLLKARRSGIATSVEAALFTAKWAQALGMQSSWVLVRPATDGPGAAISPAGYDEGLLRVAHDGEIRWMDPYCSVCAPFELRPDLEGASAYGWEVAETPAPTPGSATATTDGDRTAVTLTGPAALSLRLALTDDLGGDRKARVLAYLADGATELTTLDGLAEPGGDVTASFEGGTPRLWPDADPDGTTWMRWVGTRTWTGATGPDGAFEGEAIRWSRTTVDGVTTEVLEVIDRRVPAAERTAVEQAREALAMTPDSLGDGEADGEPEAAGDPAPEAE